MSAFAKPPSFEAAAVDAVHCGRLIAAQWPEVAVENTASMDRLLDATLQRFAAGEVFHRADEHTLSLMLGAVRQTLDSYRPGYGDFFLREHTGQAPFFDPELDAVRKLGELLKGLIEARTIVINTILAERQIQILRRR